jgi:hypothetical protein
MAATGVLPVGSTLDTATWEMVGPDVQRLFSSVVDWVPLALYFEDVTQIASLTSMLVEHSVGVNTAMANSRGFVDSLRKLIGQRSKLAIEKGDRRIGHLVLAAIWDG